MDTVKKRSIKQFVSDECANFFCTDPGYRPALWCESRGEKCSVLVTGKRCRYFEKCVLPAEPGMSGAYVIATRSADQTVLV